MPALVLLFPACAHLGSGPSEAWDRARMWDEAHGYFATYDFERADSVFTLLSEHHAETDEGRESRFYLGALLIDPRNPEWNAEESAEWLRRYIESDSEEGKIHRGPEAATLVALVNQFNIPVDERIAAFQYEPQTRVVIRSEQTTADEPPELELLRQQILAREAEIRQLRDELERIRRTLTGGQ